MKVFRQFKNMCRRITRLADRDTASFWNRMAMVLDYWYCRLFLRCSWEEYRIYGFYKYKNRYRKNFLLKSHKKTNIYDMNPPRFAKFKKSAYRRIARGIHREWLFLPEAGEQAFLEFVKKHKKVVTKPDVGSLGRRVQVFEYTDDQQALLFYYSLKADTICEEYIRQHEAMSSLNPSSVNSIRVISLCDEGKVTFMAATLKAGGTADAIVDNLHSNGVGALIDIESGVVVGKAYDYHDHTYVCHPVTGVQMVGFVVPFWKETLELVRQTHLDVAECPYLGWDVAITPTGPEIIEINDRPGPKLMQLMDQKPKGQYLKAYVRKHHIRQRPLCRHRKKK